MKCVCVLLFEKYRRACREWFPSCAADTRYSSSSSCVCVCVNILLCPKKLLKITNTNKKRRNLNDFDALQQRYEQQKEDWIQEILDCSELDVHSQHVRRT